MDLGCRITFAERTGEWMERKEAAKHRSCRNRQAILCLLKHTSKEGMETGVSGSEILLSANACQTREHCASTPSPSR